MSNKKQNHIIDTQIINLEINGTDDPNEVRQIQDAVIYFFKNNIGEEMDRVFSKLVPHDVHITLEKLELNLDNIQFKNQQELGRQLLKQIKTAVEKEVKQQLKKIKASDITTKSPRKISKLQILQHFLKFGHYPAWAGAKNGKITDVFKELITQRPNDLVALVLRLRNNAAARERLYQQFDKADLELLIEKIYGNKSKSVLKQIKLIQSRLGKASEKAILGAAIQIALQQGSLDRINKIKQRSFSRSIIEQVQDRKLSDRIDTKVRASYSGTYQDIQILDYFLEFGAIPYWADVDSKQSLQALFKKLIETQLVGVQRMVEKHANNHTFIQRLIYQFDTEDVLQLLEPTPSENLRFIKDLINDFEFLATERSKITRKIAKHELRSIVLAAAMDYFFAKGKSRFVKQTFVQNILAVLAEKTQTESKVLLHESYKTVRRKKASSLVQRTLEALDESLQEQIGAEKKLLRTAKTSYKKLQKELKLLERQLLGGTLSDTALSKIKKQQADLLQELAQLDKTIEELDTEEVPHEFELVLEERQLLQQQLQQSIQEQERQKIIAELHRSAAELGKLQVGLAKDIAKTLAEKEKVANKSGTVADKRMKRVANRLRKFLKTTTNSLQQMQQDEKNQMLYLSELRTALRQATTTEEKKAIRQERTQTEKELVALRELIVLFEEQQTALTEALQTATIEEAESGEEEALTASRTSKLDYLIFFLKYGSTPWWAEAFSKQSIEELFLDFANKEPQKLRRAFLTVGKYPVVWQRVVNQMSENAIRMVIQKTYTNHSKVIFAQADILFTIQYAQAFEQIKNVIPKTFKWLVILEYLLTGGEQFKEQKFVKEVMIQTAQNYGIAATKLLEYTYNIAQNDSEETFAPFAEWTSNLRKDAQVLEADRALIAKVRQEQLKKEGLLLSQVQQLELLIDFLQTGRISDKAKQYRYKSVADFERLLYEQIQRNKSAVKEAIFALLKISNTRSVLVNDFSEATFWEVIQLVRPQATLITQRYFEDFKRILSDDKLLLEKEVLLHFILQQTSGKFDVVEYLKSLLVFLQQQTGRQAVSILEEWKRKSLRLQGKTKSALYLAVIAIQIEIFKNDQQQSSDATIKKSIQERLVGLTEEYNLKSQQLVGVLLEEAAESQDISSKEFTYEEIQQQIKKTKKELAAAQEKLEQADVLQELLLKRQVINFQAQLKLLELQVPPTLRLISEQVEAARKELQQLESAWQEKSKTTIILESEKEEAAIIPSIAEMQLELIRLLQKESPNAVQQLSKLLIEIEDEEQRHYLFIREVVQLAQSIKDQELAATILGLIADQDKVVPTLQELSKQAGESTELDKMQQQLLQKITTASPFELWQAFEKLESYYAEHPLLQSKNQAQIIEQIYRQILRRHQRNLLEYAKVLDKEQQQLIQQIVTIEDLEELIALKEGLEQIQTRQLQQVEEIIEVARDAKIKADFKKLKANIRKRFVNIQNQRTRKYNRLLKLPLETLEQQREQQKIALQELEQSRDFVLDELQKEKKTKEVKQSPKKEAKKSKQVPKMPKIVEPLQIYNAGLVLLWPYFSRLFGVLKYVEGKNFVSEEAQFKAVHILQYLATGKLEAPENELVLNKIFCNVPLATPIPLAVDFTEEELKMADGLLVGAAKNWPKMSSMKPPAFRGSFLMREGTIEETDEKWLVKVSKKPFDVLLKTLPWGYTFIKLPWVERFVAVEWPIM